MGAKSITFRKYILCWSAPCCNYPPPSTKWQAPRSNVELQVTELGAPRSVVSSIVPNEVAGGDSHSPNKRKPHNIRGGSWETWQRDNGDEQEHTNTHVFSERQQYGNRTGALLVSSCLTLFKGIHEWLNFLYSTSASRITSALHLAAL